MPEAQRQALLALRAQILKAAPGGEDCFSYGLPGIKLHGALVWFGAAKTHCALYPHGVVADYLDRLEGYSTSKGAIRFQPDKPLPADVLRDIVLRRVRDDQAAFEKKRKRP